MIGIKIRAVICDDHSSNVSAFNKIKKEFKTDSEYFFIYTTSEDNLKIYLLFDSVHLFKNIQNNLLARKKFVFPSFNFTLFAEPIFVPDGYITWSLLHSVYDHDQLLDANLRQAYQLNYRALHPGNNKQNVSLALAVFDVTTSSAIHNYFPQCEASASFLALINTWWTISNSKNKFHPNPLGNSIIKGDNKIYFFYAMADWLKNGPSVLTSYLLNRLWTL